MKRLQMAAMAAFSMMVAAGCGAEAPAEEFPPLLPEETATVEQHASVGDGAVLYHTGEFAGNGRKCVTCHTLSYPRTGTLSPAQIAARSPSDPIFKPIDSDDGVGTNYSLLIRDATVNVTINLPSNIRLANSSARSVTIRRGIPTTLDAPSLDTMIMLDGREMSLQSQARGAIMGHAQAGREPTPDELDSIALWEKELFTTNDMKWYAKGQRPAPGIPAGTTPEEQRGRAWFEPTALCGSCHHGALLNRMTAGNPMGLPAETQFGTALVSERNKLNNPVLEYIVTNPDNTETHVITPDPGIMLVTGNAGTANLFKMLSLRNLRNTAPYFHDNSAKTIEEIMDQYNFLMDTLGIPHTDQDIQDLTAYLKLL